VIAHCSCGTVYWAEPPLSSCPRCRAPALVRAQVETLEEFEERILLYVETTAQIRSLPEAPSDRGQAPGG
jgi:hypothetical protein